MDGKGLEWTEEGRERVLECPVFAVDRLASTSPEGRRGSFYVLDAPDWAMVVPVLRAEGGARFLMVRQFRHGSGEVTLEFPGGAVERGEDPREAAVRELEEETGYRALSVALLGSVSPNPAIQGNRFHVFLAEGLSPTGRTDFDEHEDCRIEEVGEEELWRGLGEPPFTHALAATALAFWARRGRRP